MKYFAILFFLLTFSLTFFGQTPKKTPRPAKTGTETEEFEKAKAISDASQRITALQNFIKKFPVSAEIPRAQGLIIGAHAEIADKKLESGDAAGGIELFKRAVQETPSPVPNDLFTKVILGFPLSLYSRNQRAAAFDVIKLIEEKIGPNAAQILDLAKFFINIQYGTEAIRLAKKSTELAPESAIGFVTLAIANRLNFQIEDAANAYAKAAELDGASVTNKRSLAEMKRALGKPDEAITLYRELLTKDSNDLAAQTGLTLALFDAGKTPEAEAELAKLLAANPNNPPLLTGAAYWFAAHNDGAKAVEYSQKAIAADRSFVWAYIAQARGLMAQNKPLEAENILLAARQFGDFPTLDYELASARLAAGLYREAAETLKRNFAVNKEGAVETYLGNRILADANSFTELLSLERRIALFETKAADTPENTDKLKALLDFQQKLGATDATEAELTKTADEFTKGVDNMRLHRQLFAASRLLQKKTALPKVLELMQTAVGGVDSGLNVASPAAATLADEIYDSRQYAISQNLVIVVPEIPRATLSAILRGRIEDLIGLAFLQQNNPAQSLVHIKRAISVLPDKSAWSRASLWHLGETLQADGREKEALEAYLKSYDKELPDTEKRAFIETLYLKVNGNTNGLDQRIGAKPNTTVAETETKSAPTNTDNIKTTEPTPTPEVKIEPSPAPKTETAPTPELKTETTNSLPENLPTVTPVKTSETTPIPTETPKTEVQPTPEIKTEKVKPAETKPETISQIPPSPKVVESKTEEKTNAQKQIFDPVVITVGKPDAPQTENQTTAEKLPETIQKTEEKPTETIKSENKPAEKTVDEKIMSGINRPRVFITENTGAKTVTEEISTCKIIINQENLSVLNGGGSIGVMVGFEGDGDYKQITSTSSSFADVAVTLDPEINDGSRRAFFLIKSLTTKTGVFTVTFEAPCGKKEVLVRVR